jgi:hypothetical protein
MLPPGFKSISNMSFSMQPKNSTPMFSWKEEPHSFTSCPDCHLLLPCKYGSLMHMASPGGGIVPGLDRGAQLLPPTHLSIYRRKIPFLEWRLAQNIPVIPPSSHVWGQLFWVTVGIFRMNL